MGKRIAMTAAERSWVLYDVGNSAFVLVMVTALMPIFFKDYAAAGIAGAISTAKWGYANSFSSLILAVLAPILGAMSDYRGRKKGFLLTFLGLGLLFTFLLTMVNEGDWILCLSLFVIAKLGWAGANIFYDSFITDVTGSERMDVISARGYGWGYIGSVVPFLLIIGLLLWAGMEDGLPIDMVKIAFAIVGCWWLIFSIPLIINIRQQYGLAPSSSPVVDSFRRLAKTLKAIRQHRQVFLFLAAYFFYIDGVGTIISMSTAYGRDLGFGVTMLIIMLLFIQIVAFPCALLYGRLAARFSAKKVILGGIGVYCLATLLGFLLPSVADNSLKTGMFWIIAFLVASSMGGIQALSRSYYGKLIPATHSGEFFGFYNVFGKFAAITGPLIMGLVSQFTGHSRWGVLSILILFVVGGILLLQVEEQ